MIAQDSLIDLIAVLPVAAVATCALILLCLNLLFGKNQGESFPYSDLGAVIACVAGWILSVCHWMVASPGVRESARSLSALGGLLYVDSFTFIMNSILLGGAVLTIFLNDGQLAKQRVRESVDVNVLILLCVCGGMTMVAAADLIVLFLGFELLSVAVYALSGLARREKASAEGALKYFILGAFSSAFLLYGMTLVYGATGSMNLGEIANQLSPQNSLALVGFGLMLFGFGFKISIVPFHFWAPDVYQGAPVSIASFMAVVVKAAAFGSLMRILLIAFRPLSDEWVGLIWVLSVLTMSIGNIVALRQRSIKRMLAYSSIAHAGYALMGLVVPAQADGGSATLFYLVAYSLMTVAAFGIVLIASSGTEAQYDRDDISSLKNFGWRHPVLGFCMAVSMFSLAGMPPLAGFMGKFYLFKAIIVGGFPGLAVIAALNSLISLYYYLNVLVVMYFSDDEKSASVPQKTFSIGPQIAISLATLGVLYVGIVSGGIYEGARVAVVGFYESDSVSSLALDR